MLNGIAASQSYNPYASYAAYGPQAGQGTAVRSVAIPAAQPETPVTAVMPVRPVKAVQPGMPNQANLLQRWENDPAAMAVRGRIQYGADAQEADKADQADQTAGAGEDGDSVRGAQKAAEEGECQTCKERKYQDGSDDPGVSFKTAAHIDPNRAAAVVRGHEQEHVVREQAKARQEDRKVVSQSVTLHTEICPECGRAYISGGTTRTVTKAARETAPAEERTEQADGQDAA